MHSTKRDKTQEDFFHKRRNWYFGLFYLPSQFENVRHFGLEKCRQHLKSRHIAVTFVREIYKLKPVPIYIHTYNFCYPFFFRPIQ